MEIETFRGIMTGVLLVLFVAIVIGAASRKRRDTYESAARMPLEEDAGPVPGETNR